MSSSTVPSIDIVWERIKSHEGKEFQIFKKCTFVYALNESKGVLRVTRKYTDRPDKPINRNLPKSDFEKALKKVPISIPSEINDLNGPAYIWGILNDCRIRNNGWAARAYYDGSY